MSDCPLCCDQHDYQPAEHVPWLLRCTVCGHGHISNDAWEDRAAAEALLSEAGERT